MASAKQHDSSAVQLRRSAGARDDDGDVGVAQHRQEELEAEILGKHEGGVIERAEWDRKWLVLYLTFAVSGGYVLLGKSPAPSPPKPCCACRAVACG
jgi:hypothetical protein